MSTIEGKIQSSEKVSNLLEVTQWVSGRTSAKMFLSRVFSPHPDDTQPSLDIFSSVWNCTKTHGSLACQHLVKEGINIFVPSPFINALPQAQRSHSWP